MNTYLEPYYNPIFLLQVTGERKKVKTDITLNLYFGPFVECPDSVSRLAIDNQNRY